MNGLPDLNAALEWLREHWTEREMPLRLHSRDTGEDGAPAFHPAFTRHLTAEPDAMTQTTSTRRCAHVRKARNETDWQCPDCQGSGVYDSTTLVYRWPMWRAMDLLHRGDRTAHDVVLILIINSYSVDDVCEVMHTNQNVVLVSIRKLHSRYLSAPYSTPRRLGWVDKSDSQRDAERMEMATA